MMATHALDGRFLRIQNVASNAKRVRIEGQCLDPTSLTAPPLHNRLNLHNHLVRAFIISSA
jgi:hypothetical protein